MKMKTQLKTAAAFIALFISAGVSAQTLQEAIRLTDNEQYQKAKGVFTKLVTAEPTNGDYFFYFGDLMLKMEDTDTALVLFKKGVDINPMNPLTHVGMARHMMYTGKTAEGQKEIAYAKSLVSTQAGKKEMNMTPARQALVFLEIAETYTWAQSPDYAAAIELTNQAEKLDPKNPEVFLVRGDALYSKDPVNGSPAIAAYTQASKLDPKNVKAYERIGTLYANGKNMVSAIAYYNKALAIDPGFAPAYARRGEAQYQLGKFDSASISYKKYLELNDDCYSRYRYAAFLYKSGDYEGAIREGNTTLACDSSITVLYRIIGRSYMEMKTPDPVNAIKYYQLFFVKQKQYGKTYPSITADDHVNLGKAYVKNNQDSLGVEEYNKAMALDTTRKDIYFDVAGAYFKMRRYDQAALFYKKKIDQSSDGGNISDWNAYGRALFLLKDYVHADSAFRRVTMIDPPNPIGWYWRGRANAAIDTDFKSDSTRYFYEVYSDLAMKDKERNKKDLIIASKYLAGYHFIKKNYACSKAYFQLVLELDPTDAGVKKQLDTDKDLKAATAVDPGTCKLPVKQ